MMEKNPYNIIKYRHVTEKTSVLAGLATAESNRCVKKCQTPKVVFIVDRRANKQEIAQAIEEIYAKKSIKVLSVNTINVKPKVKRARGRVGKTVAIKKAIVTLEAGDTLDDVS